MIRRLTQPYEKQTTVVFESLTLVVNMQVLRSNNTRQTLGEMYNNHTHQPTYHTPTRTRQTAEEICIDHATKQAKLFHSNKPLMYPGEMGERRKAGVGGRGKD